MSTLHAAAWEIVMKVNYNHWSEIIPNPFRYSPGMFALGKSDKKDKAQDFVDHAAKMLYPIIHRAVNFSSGQVQNTISLI